MLQCVVFSLNVIFMDICFFKTVLYVFIIVGLILCKYFEITCKPDYNSYLVPFSVMIPLLELAIPNWERIQEKLRDKNKANSS